MTTIRTAKQLNTAAAKGRYVIRTMGEGYSLDTGQSVAAKAWRNYQLDLFCQGNERVAVILIPQEDGLFPGFSQTWRQ